MSSEHGFGADHERASELGKQGGHASGDSTDNSDGSKNYSSKDHDGLKQGGSFGSGLSLCCRSSDCPDLCADGTPDKRLNSEHGFGGDRGRASEAGKKGGQA